jgi:hypothetical protein
VKKKDKYIVDVTLDVIIVQDAASIMHKLYVLLILMLLIFGRE